MLPPGWMMAFAPASASTSTPSRNGKKASDATTEPAMVRPACSALIRAMRVESTRLIWPAPTPTVAPSRQYTMAFDFTYMATRQAKVRSVISCAVGARFVTTLRRPSSDSGSSAVWISRPEPTRFTSCRLRPRAQAVAAFGSTPSSGISSTRTLALAASSFSASAVKAGAISTSTNWPLTASAVAASTGVLKAMMPPKAEVGSVAKALR